MVIDPASLDAEGRWLEDRIAKGQCHYYFCGGRGTERHHATYCFVRDGVYRAVEYPDAPVCHYHKTGRPTQPKKSRKRKEDRDDGRPPIRGQ